MKWVPKFNAEGIAKDEKDSYVHKKCSKAPNRDQNRKGCTQAANIAFDAHASS
jgi:hypothetical protein